MAKVYLFRADVAAYCDEAQRLVEEIKKEHPSLELHVFDIDRDRSIARKFGVTKVPTVVVDDAVKFTGVPSKEQILKALEAKRRRIPTGIGFVDALTRGGVIRGDVVLVEGDVGAGKTSFCAQVAAKAVNEGMEAVYACTTETPDEIRERIASIESENVALKVRMVDLYSWRLGELYKSREKFGTESITDLAKLLSVITDATRSGDASQTILFFDSLSELLLHNELEEVVYFFEKLSAKLKIDQTTSVFVLEDIHPPLYLETIRYLSNEIFELRLDREDELRRKFRVYKTRLGDHAKHWMPYQITARGLVTEEAFR